MLMGSILFPIGVLLYGWSAQYRVFWLVTDIGAVIFSTAMMFLFVSINNYIVDTFGIIAASAIAATTFLRSLAGFGLPLAGPTMYANLGYGVGNTILAAIVAAIGIPAPFLLWHYGPWLRSKSNYAVSGQSKTG